MADPRFHARRGPFALAELAGIGTAELADPRTGAHRIADVATLDMAGPDDLGFFDNRKYRAALSETGAGAVVLQAKDRGLAPDSARLLLSERPYRSYALIAQHFYPRPAPMAGIAEGAVIADDATIGDGCEIGANAVIGAGVEIGARCLIGPQATIGPGCRIGDDCRIAAATTLSHALIGDRVSFHPGARIGQDGFGFAPDPAGHVKVPQVGRVVIGDDCDIGANTAIDRGALGDTVLGPGCWLDNLVQIGHNVRLGRGCIVVAQVGISGSTRIGDFVAIGGQSGFAGHLSVGDGAQIAAQSGVIADVPPGATLCGAPAQDIKEFFRQVALLKRLSAEHRKPKS